MGKLKRPARAPAGIMALALAAVSTIAVAVAFSPAHAGQARILWIFGGTHLALALGVVLWLRHRERLDGLVLGATAPYFAGRRPERLSFVGLTGLAAIARYTPSQARAWITDQLYLQRKTDEWGPWAVEQVAAHDWRMILEAGKAIGAFSSSDWISDVDVPTSVIATMDDPVVPLRRQVKLWRWIPDAEVFRVQGGHDAVVSRARQFVPQLVRAVRSVLHRSMH